MADEIIKSSKPDSQNDEATAASGDGSQSVSLNMSHIVNICALGVLIAFFLPWINVLFGKPSGLDFAKEGGQFSLLWSIPIMSAITIAAGISKQSQKVVGELTGALPFCALGLGLYHNGQDLLKVLEIGAYASLASGLVLSVVARRLK